MANTWTYNYTGTEQLFVVPSTGIYKIDLYGAQGANSKTDRTEATGGLGGHLTQYVRLNAGDNLYITCGGQNGFNGGGAGGTSNDKRAGGGNGGGATHIATESGLLRMIAPTNVVGVAGGGAGGYSNASLINSGFTSDRFTTTIGSAPNYPQDNAKYSLGWAGAGSGYYDGDYGYDSNGQICVGYGQCRAVAECPEGYTNAIVNRVRGGDGYAVIEKIGTTFNVSIGSVDIANISIGNNDISAIGMGVN